MVANTCGVLVRITHNCLHCTSDLFLQTSVARASIDRCNMHRVLTLIHKL